MKYIKFICVSMLILIFLSLEELYTFALATATPNSHPAPSSKQNIKASKSHIRTQRHDYSVYTVSENNTYPQIADILGWVPDDSANSFCGGYYVQPSIVSLYPNPLPISKAFTHASAHGPTTFERSGAIMLQDHVVVTQKGRLSTSDKAYIYRNSKTHRISLVKLIGHVRLHENDKLFAGPYGILNTAQHTATFGHTLYHVYSQLTPLGKYNAWGKADHAERLADSTIKLWNATYTTCSPLNPTWYIKASYINLNKKTGVGHAKNVVLRFKNVPIFYFPSYSFSIDNKRKSGFLSPQIEITKNNGYGVGLPYYFNLAPNYDLLFTPYLYTRRGAQLTALFRFLTHNSGGWVYASALPYDESFKKFRESNINQYNGQSTLQPFVNELKKDSNSRGYFGLKDIITFDPMWSAELNLNYVTDSYYLRDFTNSYATISANQLLNQVDVRYSGWHWQIFTMMQAYQTLHLIDALNGATPNQYMRLPEMDIFGQYPNAFDGFNFNVQTQIVNFAYSSTFTPTTWQLPIGQRVHLRPAINRPFNWAWGYITPQISLDSVNYNTSLPRPGPTLSRPTFSASRNIPIGNIDSGLYFSRNFNFGHHSYIQTLEPRLFYLYVPYVNQNDLPNFDTQLFPFTTEFLYTLNRFTGYDRLENANQTSLSLTSRILNGETSNQILRFDIGLIYYFTRPRVTLSPTSTLPPQGNISPIVAQLTYNPFTHWSVSQGIAWDTKNRVINNSITSLIYNSSSSQLFSIGYEYQHQSANAPSTSRTSQIIFGFAWPLSAHWQTLGYFYYDFALHRTDTYYGGIEYNGCCWALRFILSRNAIGVTPNTTNTVYDTAFYVQFQLKGLANIGLSNPHSLLQSTLPQYHDNFAP